MQGDLFRGTENETVISNSLVAPFTKTMEGELEFEGGYILGRWTHRFSEISEYSLQLCYDRVQRDSVLLSGSGRVFDLDFQHRLPIGHWHDVVWGAGYLLSHDRLGSTPDFMVENELSKTEIVNFFLQDEITLSPDRLHLALGTKLEGNSHSGFEVQPSGRLTWTPNNVHTIWLSVSRAVRTPSRLEQDVRINRTVLPPFAPIQNMGPSPYPTVFAIKGGDWFDSEELLAIEFGYRVNPGRQFSLDFAGFLQ